MYLSQSKFGGGVLNSALHGRSITKFSTAKYPVPVLYKDGDVGANIG